MGRIQLTVVAAAAALVLMVSPADAKPKRSCGPRSAGTVARSDSGRVFTRTRRVDETTYMAACLFRGGRPIVLSEDPDGGSGVSWNPGPFVLAGRFVAFVDGSCMLESCGGSFEVVDIKRRRLVRSEPDFRGEASRIVLTFSGLAAALAGDYSGAEYVETLDRRGPSTVDRGPDLSSLTLDGHRVGWLHDGEPRIARLR
jgi:hypothetical protein